MYVSVSFTSPSQFSSKMCANLVYFLFQISHHSHSFVFDNTKRICWTLIICFILIILIYLCALFNVAVSNTELNSAKKKRRIVCNEL